MVIYGLVLYGGTFLLCGKKLSNVDIFLCDNDAAKIGGVDIIEATDEHIRFNFIPIPSIKVA